MNNAKSRENVGKINSEQVNECILPILDTERISFPLTVLLLAFWVSLPVIIVERNSVSLSGLVVNVLARVDTFLLLTAEQVGHEFGGKTTRSNCPSKCSELTQMILPSC
jgi:hypothetical protein